LIGLAGGRIVALTIAPRLGPIESRSWPGPGGSLVEQVSPLIGPLRLVANRLEPPRPAPMHEGVFLAHLATGRSGRTVSDTIRYT
jgi:hypothetical protein